MSEEVDTKDTEDQLHLIGEQLSFVFPKQWKSSGCDNTIIESSSINDVSAFDDTVTHNHQKKSKLKSEEVPVMEKKGKKP